MGTPGQPSRWPVFHQGPVMTAATDLASFAYTLYALCKLHSGSVTSWIRSKEHNRKIGGDPRTFHLSGMAADVVLDSPSGNSSFIRDARLLGLQAIDEGDHIHVEADNAITRLAR